MIAYRFVNDTRADLPINRRCELLELPRSSFHAWLNHKPSARDLADQVLLEEIVDIYRRSRSTYGVPGSTGSSAATAAAWPAPGSLD